MKKGRPILLTSLVTLLALVGLSGCEDDTSKESSLASSSEASSSLTSSGSSTSSESSEMISSEVISSEVISSEIVSSESSSSVEEEIRYAFDIQQDETIGTIEVKNSNDVVITDALPGEKIKLVYKGVNNDYLPIVKVDGNVLTYNSQLGGYFFNMPTSEVVIALTYQKQTASLKVESLRVATDMEYARENQTSLLYNLKIGDKVLEEAYPGLNVYEGIEVGEEVQIVSLNGTSTLTGAKELKRVYIGEQEITFVKDKSEERYVFDSFIMPKANATLRFEFVESSYYDIFYEVDNNLPLTIFDADYGLQLINPDSIKEHTSLKISFEANDKFKFNFEETGVYNPLTNQKIASFDYRGNTYEAKVNYIDSPLRIKVRYDVRLEDNYFALDGIKATDSKKNILKIDSSLNYQLIQDDNYEAIKSGTLNYNHGEYVSNDGKMNIKPKLNEQGDVEFLLTTLRDGDNISYFVFSNNSFIKIKATSPYLEGMIANIYDDVMKKDYWLHFDTKSGKIVTFINFDTSFNKDTIYELIEDQTTTYLKHDGNRLYTSSSERGIYHFNDEPQYKMVFIDGFDKYHIQKQDGEMIVGNYVYDEVNDVMSFKLNGSYYHYYTNRTKNELMHYEVPATDLGGYYYEFRHHFIVEDEEGFKYEDSKYIGSLKFRDGNIVHIDMGGGMDASYQIKDTVLTIKINAERNLVFTFDPLTYMISHTSGYYKTEGDFDKIQKQIPSGIDATLNESEGKFTLSFDPDYLLFRYIINGVPEQAQSSYRLVIGKDARLNLQIIRFDYYEYYKVDMKNKTMTFNYKGECIFPHK